VYLKNILSGRVSIALPATTCAAHGVQIVRDSLLPPKVLHDPTTLDRLRRLHAKWDAYAQEVGLHPGKRTEVFDSPSSTVDGVPPETGSAGSQKP
jgi:hypothetical protein